MPKGWVVCNIADVMFVRTGATFNKDDSTTQQKNNYIRVLRGGNISYYSTVFRNDDIFIPSEIVNDNIIAKQYDIITPAVTSLENIGKMSCLDFTLEETLTVGGFVYLLSPIFRDYIFAKFIVYQLTSAYFINQLKGIAKKSGAAFYNINKTKFSALPFFMPPYKEQKRIVACIELLFSYLDIVDENQTEIEQLSDDLKKKILDLAISGKLVPQDSNDEPASVLLERIRAEKKAQLGKKYVESYIYKGDDNCYYEKIGPKVRNITEELPFEIPETWGWVRLGTIFQHNTGKALNSSNIKGTLHKYITTSNLYWGVFKLDKLREMLFTDDEVEKCSVQKGDLLVCEGGDIGRAAVWNFDYPMCIQNHIHKLRPLIPLNIYFYFYVFYAYKSSGLIGGKGIGIQGLSSNALDRLLLPLPSVNEQNQIIHEVNLLISKLKGEN